MGMPVELSITNASGRPISELLLVMRTEQPYYHYLIVYARELKSGAKATGQVSYNPAGPYTVSFHDDDGGQWIQGAPVMFNTVAGGQPQPMQITYSGTSFQLENASSGVLNPVHPADIKHEAIWLTPTRIRNTKSAILGLEFSPYQKCVTVDQDTTEKTFWYIKLKPAEKDWDAKLKACSFSARIGSGGWNKGEVDRLLGEPRHPQPSESNPGSVISFKLPPQLVDEFKKFPDRGPLKFDYTLDVGIDPEVEMEGDS